MKCVFEGCKHQTNVYGTFATHKHRKHTPHTSQDFKPGIISELPKEALDFETSEEDGGHSGANYEGSNTNAHYEEEDGSNVIVEYIVSLLMKLESVHNVSVRCIDELVDDLHFIASSAPISSVKSVIVSHFQKNNQTIDDTFVTSLVEDLCKSNPLTAALSSADPLSSSFKRQQYYKEKSEVVEPVEYVLEPNEKRSFQYIPILQSLIQILGKENLREKVLSKEQNKSSTKYESYQDGTIYKENSFYSEELRITLVLYVDEFEVCNPLGTSRKKHKITAVYWVFDNIPHSQLCILGPFM